MSTKQAQKKQIRKKQVNYIQTLKDITKWVTNPKRSDEQLDYLITKYKLDNNLIKRIISYNLGYPYIIFYFNRYLNDLYGYNSLDTRILFKSVAFIMDLNNRNNPKNFMYLKASDMKDEIKDVIKKLIQEYMDLTYNVYLNNRELNFYYKLFKIGIISDEDLLLADKTLNGDKPVIKSLNFVNYRQALDIDNIDTSEIQNMTDSQEPETNVFDQKPKVKSNAIIEFINSVKQQKSNSEICQACELYKQPIVVLDTNSDNLGEVDIAFIGTNPSKDDVDHDNPFVGEIGTDIRKMIHSLPRKIKWVIFNVILCHTNTKKEIKDVDQVLNNCINLTQTIFESFPASTYIPIGEEAKNLFGIDEKITAVSGKVFNTDTSRIIPLIHPSSASKNDKFKAILDKSIGEIIKLYSDSLNIVPGKAPSKQPAQATKEMKQNLVIEDTSDLLLVDVKKIENNQILMIYTDLAGQKKYHIQDFSFPIMIKNSKYNMCEPFTTQVNDICYVNDYQKSKISQICHQKLKQLSNL